MVDELLIQIMKDELHKAKSANILREEMEKSNMKIMRDILTAFIDDDHDVEQIIQALRENNISLILSILRKYNLTTEQITTILHGLHIRIEIGEIEIDREKKRGLSLSPRPDEKTRMLPTMTNVSIGGEHEYKTQSLIYI